MRRHTVHWGRQRQLFLAGWLVACAATASYSADLQPEIEALQAFDQARIEITSQRYDRAEILLERVLMLHPENAEARIELAMLMARRGHTDGAQALVQSLLDDPRTEPDHNQALRSLLQQIKNTQPALANPYALDTRRAKEGLTSAAQNMAQPNARQPTAALWRGEASITASSNPLARTSAGAITITLPDGPLSLPLSLTAKPGSLAGATLSRITATHGAELSVQTVSVTGATAGARAVLWSQVPWVQWLPETIKPLATPPVLAFAQVQRGLDGQSRTMAGLNTLLGTQRLSLSHYEDHGINDRGIVVRAEYIAPRMRGADLQASLEHSNSSTGLQAHWRVGLGAEYGLGGRSKLLAQITHQQDAYSYSALLQEGAKRRLTTTYVAYEQQYPLKSEKILIWRVFSSERQSNLELFKYNDRGAQLSIVQNWR
jgi:hypothetical protein